MWIPGWPGTWDPPASVSCILKSQVCITTPIFRRRLSHRGLFQKGILKEHVPLVVWYVMRAGEVFSEPLWICLGQECGVRFLGPGCWF